MTNISILLTAIALSLFLAGIYLLIFPKSMVGLSQRWMKGGVMLNLLLFTLGIGGMLVIGVNEVMAAESVGEGEGAISLGPGLALIGIGLPTSLAPVGAGQDSHLVG